MKLCSQNWTYDAVHQWECELPTFTMYGKLDASGLCAAATSADSAVAWISGRDDHGEKNFENGQRVSYDCVMYKNQSHSV